MNTSQISGKPPEKQVQGLQTRVSGLEGLLQRQVPFGEYEFVEVTFNSTANGDTEVKHSLRTSDPEAIRVIPVEWQFASTPVDPPYVWRNIASTARPWGEGYIILRCNLASAKARLLLITESA